VPPPRGPTSPTNANSLTTGTGEATWSKPQSICQLSGRTTGPGSGSENRIWAPGRRPPAPRIASKAPPTARLSTSGPNTGSRLNPCQFRTGEPAQLAGSAGRSPAWPSACCHIAFRMAAAWSAVNALSRRTTPVASKRDRISTSCTVPVGGSRCIRATQKLPVHTRSIALPTGKPHLGLGTAGASGSSLECVRRNPPSTGPVPLHEPPPGELHGRRHDLYRGCSVQPTTAGLLRLNLDPGK